MLEIYCKSCNLRDTKPYCELELDIAVETSNDVPKRLSSQKHYPCYIDMSPAISHNYRIAALRLASELVINRTTDNFKEPAKKFLEYCSEPSPENCKAAQELLKETVAKLRE